MTFKDNSFIKAEGIYYAGILRDSKKSRNPLQPIYEAFTNSLESIILKEDKESSNSITVKMFFRQNLLNERDFYKVEVDDTGVGFNNKEFKRFITYKDNRKGFHNKGSGRLQFIHYFNNCKYCSIFKDGNEFIERRFQISNGPNYIKENALVFIESTKATEVKNTLTTISLSHLNDDKDKIFYQLSIADLKESLITHYMPYFCAHREKLPNIFIHFYVNDILQEKETIAANDIPSIDNKKDFKLNYNKISEDGKNIVKTSNTETFHIKSFRINKNKLDKNSIKLTSKDELVESNDFKLNLNSLSNEDHIGNDRFLFLISSPFIDIRDDDSRGELKIVKRENYKNDFDLFTEEEIFFDDIEVEANNNILLMYDEIKKKNQEKQNEIDELRNMFLLNDDVLKDISISLNDNEEKILEKVYTAESKLIAKGDVEIKRQIDELNKLNPASNDYEKDFAETINRLVKEIPLQNRTALTRYVARRKLVLELFDKILNNKLDIQKNNKKNLDEKLLHNLIFKQKSTEVDISDLWLINEDFILFQGVSEFQLKDININGVKILKEILSDEEIKYRDSLKENRGQKRPDVLLFPNEGKCIIIEFKAPDVNVSEHINQINRYASLIRNLSKDDMQFDTFYGYLIGETLDADDVRDFDADFKNAAHFDYVFRPAKTIAGKFGRSDGSLYTEVIKYSTLSKRARERNNVFIEKLSRK